MVVPSALYNTVIRFRLTIILLNYKIIVDTNHCLDYQVVELEEQPISEKEEEAEPIPEPTEEETKTEAVEPVKEVSADSAEPELEKLVEPEEPEVLQTAAVNLINDVFQTLDLEAASESEE